MQRKSELCKWRWETDEEYKRAFRFHRRVVRKTPKELKAAVAAEQAQEAEVIKQGWDEWLKEQNSPPTAQQKS